MRLPIQSMQPVRLRPSGTEHWFRSVIVDFDPENELVVLRPTENDRETDDSGSADSSEGEDQVVGTPGTGEPHAETPSDEQEVGEPHFERGARLDVEIPFVDGIRSFKSVVRRLDPGYGGSLRIAWPTEGTRIQRRDFVRVEISARTVLWVPEEKGRRKIAGYTVDFSAGGVRLKLTEPLPADLRIEIEIGHPALESQVLEGRVVRSGEIEKKRRDLQYYWVAVEFVGVDESLRNDLTQLVFIIQREQMRKNLA